MEPRELLWTAGLAFVVATVIVTAVGCGGVYQEGCTPGDVEKAVAAHEARLAQVCLGQGEDCPDRKVEDARFKEELRAWVRCDRESEPKR